MKTRKYLLMMALAVISTFTIVGCDKDDDNTDHNQTVTMSGGMFGPASLQVEAGTTVTWRNDDDEMHTVTASDGSFDSGDLDPDETFTHSFSEGGTFAYICKHHSGMTGTIIVVAD
jgi:plastocyanin